MTSIKTDFKQVREILKKISHTNFDKLSVEFAAIVNCESKQMPELANLFVEMAVIDAYNQPLLAMYAKLISRAINPPTGIRLRMLGIEVTNTLCSVMALMLKLPCKEKATFVTSLLQKEEIGKMVPRARNNGMLCFVGEMYNHDVLELSDLKDRVIHPLLETGTDETLDYLCKILMLVWRRINTEISNSGELADHIWFDGLFAKLETCSTDPARSNSTKFAVQNLVELRKSSGDGFKRKDNAVGQHVVPTEADFISADESLPPMESLAHVKKTSGSSSRPLIRPAPCEQHMGPLAALPSTNRCQAMYVTGSGQCSSGYPTLFPSSLVTASAVSSSAASRCSRAVSISSVPAVNQQRVKDIDAKRVFDQFVPEGYRTTPLRERIKWLKQEFKDQNKTQRLAVIRSLSILMTTLQYGKEVAAMGQLLDCFIRAKLISEDELINALQSGVMLELPKLFRSTPGKEYDHIVMEVARALMTCWQPRLEDFSWLAALGATIHETEPAVWFHFSFHVLDIARYRKNIRIIRACYDQTSPELKSMLDQQARSLKIAR